MDNEHEMAELLPITRTASQETTPVLKVSEANQYTLRCDVPDPAVFTDPAWSARATVEVSRDEEKSWVRWAHVDWRGGAPTRGVPLVPSFRFVPAPPAGVSIRFRIESDRPRDLGLDLVEETILSSTSLDHRSVAYDNDSEGQATSTVGFSVTHVTGAGDNRALGAGISWYPETVTITDLDYAGEANNLSSVGGISDVGGDRSEIWKLNAPTSGSNALAVTFSSTASEAIMGCMTMADVDQTTSTGTYASASGTSAAPSVATTAAAADLVFSNLIWWPNPSHTATADQTQMWSLKRNDVAGGGGSRTQALNPTMSWTLSGSTDWALGAVAFKAAAGGAAVRKDLLLLGVGQ